MKRNDDLEGNNPSPEIMGIKQQAKTEINCIFEDAKIIVEDGICTNCGDLFIAKLQEILSISCFMTILQKTGACLFSKPFDSKLEPDLVAGFISATQLFISELTQDDTDKITVFGRSDFNFIVFKGVLASSVLILKKRPTSWMKDQLMYFHREYEKKYERELNGFKGNVRPFSNTIEILMEHITQLKFLQLYYFDYEKIQSTTLSTFAQQILTEITEIHQRGIQQIYLKALLLKMSLEKPRWNYDNTITAVLELVEKKILITEKYEEQKSRLKDLYDKSVFKDLGRMELKSPLELIKETPPNEIILPIMGQMFKLKNIREQINHCVQKNFIKVYPGTWADSEVQLIGYYILKNKLMNLIEKFNDMYDAGCADRGQLKSLKELLEDERNERINSNFCYMGQDFLPEWQKNFDPNSGQFFLNPLPVINEEQNKQHTLVCCTHTLHYLAYNPIAMYTSIFSFNYLLKVGGYCYITIPVKTAKPGMLDLLQKAAVEANFEIIDSSKCRLIHKLRKEPLNITTFSYLILQKRGDINVERWRNLIGISMYKANCFQLARKYGINGEEDFPKKIIFMEKNFKFILEQRDLNFSTFRYALDIMKKKLIDKVLGEQILSNSIRESIKEIHPIYIKTDQKERKEELKLKFDDYFFLLMSFYISNWKEELKKEEVLYNLYAIVNDIFNNNEDIRVNLKEPSVKDITRLLKNLFEICEYEHIDLRKGLLTRTKLLNNNN